MRVAYGGVGWGMGKQILKLINWDAVIHQNAGQAMAQITEQVSTAMLAQANAFKQNALSLLQG